MQLYLNPTKVSFLFYICNRILIFLFVSSIVCLGERQKLSVKIDSRSAASMAGILLLESQTEGMTISNVSKVSAILKRQDKQEEVIELDMLETGEIILVDLNKNDHLELFVMYEGPYTEFDYRVSHKTIQTDFISNIIKLDKGNYYIQD